MIKYIIKCIIYFLLHIFWVLPIDKKKIYFVSYQGRQYSCNPKYLYLYIKDKFFNEYNCIWEFINLENKQYVPSATVVKRNSIRALINQLTSKYIIANTEYPWYVPLRKNQVLLQTWHGGGAYKKVGLATKSIGIAALECKLNAKNIKYYISSCKKFSEVQSRSKYLSLDKFINTGMPRNAFLLTRHDEVKLKVYDYFHIRNNYHILLFAPTYRGENAFKTSGENYLYKDFDYDGLIYSLKKKFNGEWIVLYRGHYYDSKLHNVLSATIIDATLYPDMQELLYVSDILITDYSSSMWDFCLMHKPGFIYLPDIDYYVKKNLFYTDPAEWPFSVSNNFEQLINNIEKFSFEENMKKIDNHLEKLESYENANACELVLQSIGMV